MIDLRALSLRQPWAWAILHAGKDIENRKWNTRVRGRIALHAAYGMTLEEYQDGCDFINSIKPNIVVPAFEQIIRGAIVGLVEITDVVRKHSSPWFEGPYGFVVARPQLLAMPIECPGALGFWNVSPELVRLIESQTE
jgi:hypothetical protein